METNCHVLLLNQCVLLISIRNFSLDKNKIDSPIRPQKGGDGTEIPYTVQQAGKKSNEYFKNA